MAKGEIFDAEYRLRRADGTYRWHIGRNVPLKDEKGNVMSWFGSATDIQDLKVAQASLRESEERYRAIVNQTSVGIFRADKDGGFLYLNDKGSSMLGFSPAELEEKTVWDITPPEYLEENQRLFKRLFSDGLPFQMEKKLKRKNGSQFWVTVSVAPIKGANGKVQSAVAVVIDITGRKQAEEALRETMERFQYAVQATRDVIWEIDFSRNHVWWSSMMHSIFGYSQKEVQHSLAWYQSLIHPDERKQVAKSFTAVVEGKESLWADEFRYRQASGDYLYVTCRAFIIREPAGNALRMIGAMQDITDRKTVEQKKDEFIGIASHELKTPVTAIKAYTEILYDQFVEAGDEMSALYLSKLNSQVDRLTGLIRDLLDATRISEGRLMLKSADFDINQLVRESADELQRTTSNHTIQLELGEMPLYKGDKERLQQVFVNLLSNAIKYSPEADTVLVKTYFENGNINIAVQDFGIGMSPETQSKLFERFFRSSDLQLSTFPGLGLGLYISLQLVKQHKGTIRVHSEKGKGSVFTVVLPVAYRISER